MASVRVPPQYQATLQAVAMLAPRTASRLVKVVEELPPFTPIPRIFSAVSAILPKSAGELNVGQLIVTLSTLSTDLGSRGTDMLARDLAFSPDLDIPPDQRDRIAGLMKRLLSAEVVTTFGKADDVITDHANVFSKARILTDIRPVFRDDAAQTPTAAVIVEMLRIVHWNRADNERASFYVALDHSDLLALKGVIDRAVEKTETLKTFLESAGLSYYEHQEMPSGSS